VNGSPLKQLECLATRADAEAWADAAELIRAGGGYRWVGLYVVAETEIRAVAWTGSTPPAFPRFPRDKGLNGVAVRAKAPVLCQDVSKDARYIAAFPNTGSEAVFPVLSDSGDVVGTIDVESDRRSAFSWDDEQFLTDCAAKLRSLWISPPK
jgi:putative methionine-R-sulfoxide reductase with GAF domain